MKKTVLAAASFDNEKYYMESAFDSLPEGIKNEIREICVCMAEKLMCTFIMGFRGSGDIYFETVKSHSLPDFDDIGAELEIKRISSQRRELLKALKLWYVIYKTPEGKEILKNIEVPNGFAD